MIFISVEEEGRDLNHQVCAGRHQHPHDTTRGGGQGGDAVGPQGEAFGEDRF